MFALFEDDVWSAKEPQASLPSAAQPAVKDIRRLRRRLLEIYAHNVQAKIQNAKKRIVPIVSIVFKTTVSKKQLYCFKNKKSVLKKSIQTKRGCKPSLRTQAIKQ